LSPRELLLAQIAANLGIGLEIQRVLVLDPSKLLDLKVGQPPLLFIDMPRLETEADADPNGRNRDDKIGESFPH
jgi:hypothetical protein